MTLSDCIEFCTTCNLDQRTIRNMREVAIPRIRRYHTQLVTIRRASRVAGIAVAGDLAAECRHLRAAVSAFRNRIAA